MRIYMAERKWPVDPVLDHDLGQGVFENLADGVPLVRLAEDQIPLRPLRPLLVYCFETT